MANLGGQRAQFTWALNEYNKSEDPDTRAKFARRMAKYIAAAPANAPLRNDESRPSNVEPHLASAVGTGKRQLDTTILGAALWRVVRSDWI